VFSPGTVRRARNWHADRPGEKGLPTSWDGLGALTRRKMHGRKAPGRIVRDKLYGSLTSKKGASPLFWIPSLLKLARPVAISKKLGYAHPAHLLVGGGVFSVSGCSVVGWQQGE